MEEWKPTKGYESRYAVSSAGRIWDLYKNIEVTQVIYINLPTEREVGAKHFENMKKQVAAVFPCLTPKQVIYLCNKVTNTIRKMKTGVYDVVISDEPVWHRGYCSTFEITTCGVTLYGSVLVD